MEKQKTQEEYQGRSLGDRLKTLGRVLTPFYAIKDASRLENRKLSFNQNAFNQLYSGILAAGILSFPLAYGLDVHETGKWDLEGQRQVKEQRQNYRNNLVNLRTSADTDGNGKLSVSELSDYCEKTGEDPSGIEFHRESAGIRDYFFSISPEKVKVYNEQLTERGEE